jgi:hypothetical protein
VGYAHSQGVIHRDLKPANVMVGSFGEVQVMDWGLAKSGIGERRGVSPPVSAQCDNAPALPARGTSARATQMGRAMGTPQYMPPEQARGEWDRVGFPADVFALGGILATILTGQPPYTGNNPYLVLRRAERGDLGECLARLDATGADEELLALAKRCLAVNIEDRPANGAEVARQIATYRVGVEMRLIAAEREGAAAAALAEEARMRAMAERMARRDAEARAEEADLFADVIAAQARDQLRRQRGVFIGFASVLLILAGVYGHYRAQKARAERAIPAEALPSLCECEGAVHINEHEGQIP